MFGMRDGWDEAAEVEWTQSFVSHLKDFEICFKDSVEHGRDLTTRIRWSGLDFNKITLNAVGEIV